MAAGMALTVVQTLLTALQCTELRELSSMLGYKSKLEDLKRTVTMIKAVLLDADSKHQELTQAGCDWVEKLKDAVYDADDLFDELTIKAQQLKRMPGGKLSKKVNRFFSHDNQLLFGFNKSREIKKLRDKLDCIAEDRNKFGVSDDYKPVKRREETCSYVFETNIIGREKEKDEIVEMLLSDITSISFVSIVGIGGLGKTALAQLVFNDKRIKDTFGKDLYWVCVSDEFGLKEILCKLHDNKNNCTLEDLQKEVREKIEGKRYLLVLDDVWEENHYEWLKLKEFLCSGGGGSRILVTTRSKEVAEAVDKDLMFELKGLSEENSWHLFKKIAFGQGDNHDTRLIEIGKDIVKKCANVPLSLKVTSSLLHGRDESKWEAFRNMDLTNMKCYGEKDNIMSTLMFSYYNLTPELKSCFSICSLFPKDYVMKKEVLISLWLAQGYLVPSHEGDSMEDIGVDYFWILLQRCFFQDVERDEYGEIHSCKMHDLIHDLALKVAGKESLMSITSSTEALNKKLRHLSAIHIELIDDLSSKCCPSRKTLRTLFTLHGYSSDNVARMVLNCRRLRVLHLERCGMNLLPEEIGNFLHLRYLDVSYNWSLKMLPRSITKLHNLQIINLRECIDLFELPKDIGKLVNLRMLDISGCSQLEELPESIGELVNLRFLKMYKSDYLSGKITYMPAGMEKLRNLRTLPYFVVGGDSSKQVRKGELIDLKGLISLNGHLCIKVGKFSPSNMPIATKGADILRKARLKGLEIICGSENGQDEYHEMLLEGLYPNNDLRELVMSRYKGITFPNWGSGKLSFPAGIVRMVLTYCVGLEHLSSLSKLVHLKYLCLDGLKNLEYIESDAPCDVSETFFPSLEELLIQGALNLKRWWKGIKRKKEPGGGGYLVDANGSCVEFLPSFTRLCDLRIDRCRRLKYFPPCPHLKILQLARVNEAFTFCMKSSSYFHTSAPSSDLSSGHPTIFCLKKLKTNDEEVWNSLFRESFLGCVDIELYDLASVKEIREIRAGFQRCACSVRHLSITKCHFQSLSGGGIEYLTNLQSLIIKCCVGLESLGEDDDDEMPWKSIASLSSLELGDLPRLVTLPKGFQYLISLQKLIIEGCHNLEVEGMHWRSLQSLSSLKLIGLQKLENLPKDFQYLSSLQSLQIVSCDKLEGLGEFVGSLTSLRSLYIGWCPKLTSLPEAMSHLTSLTQLEIVRASFELKERCRKPDGEDWPKVCHIPNLKIDAPLMGYM